MHEELRPCPFCGGQVEIVCCDDEGNPHTVDYEQDPWSGIGYRIKHSVEKNEVCPIARYEGDGATMGVYIYDTREEATQYWNKRANNTAEKVAIDFEADFAEVVRCKDCKHFKKENGGYCSFGSGLTVADENGYCSYGERAEQELRRG